MQDRIPISKKNVILGILNDLAILPLEEFK